MAEKLGRTVEELLLSISSRELSEWMVHLATHNTEADYQTARLIQAFIAPYTDKVPDLESLVPRRTKTDQSPEQMAATLAAYR